MYHAVSENIAAIKASGYTLLSLPGKAIGAELQNPSTGAIAEGQQLQAAARTCPPASARSTTVT